jgi:hypothetical protein
MNSSLTITTLQALGQVELLTKLVENGIIAAAFLYILYWLLNKQSQLVSENSKRTQLTNIEVAQSIRGMINIVMGMQQQLMLHDLTVTGLAPTDEADSDLKDSLAYKKYSEVMSTLEEQRALIRQMNESAEVRMKELRT